MPTRHAPGLLLASPALADPHFAHSVVLLFHHDGDGAMGVIVNRPTDQTVGAFLDSIGASPREPAFRRLRVGNGGPVAEGIGWVVFDADLGADQSLAVDGTLRVSTSRQVLDELLAHGDPDRFHLLMGHAGWGPGQLDAEIEGGAWLPVPVDRELLFQVPPPQRWRRAYASIGIDPAAWFGTLANG